MNILSAMIKHGATYDEMRAMCFHFNNVPSEINFYIDFANEINCDFHFKVLVAQKGDISLFDYIDFSDVEIYSAVIRPDINIKKVLKYIKNKWYMANRLMNDEKLLSTYLNNLDREDINEILSRNYNYFKFVDSSIINSDIKQILSKASRNEYAKKFLFSLKPKYIVDFSDNIIKTYIVYHITKSTSNYKTLKNEFGSILFERLDIKEQYYDDYIRAISIDKYISTIDDIYSYYETLKTNKYFVDEMVHVIAKTNLNELQPLLEKIKKDNKKEFVKHLTNVNKIAIIKKLGIDANEWFDIFSVVTIHELFSLIGLKHETN